MKNINRKTNFLESKTVILFIVIFIFQNSVWPQTKDFPYKLNSNNYYIIPATIGVYVTSKCLDDTKKLRLSVDEIKSLNRSDVNYFDRFTTYNRNTKIGSIGDVCYIALPMIPLALTIPQIYNKQWENAAVYGLMYLEVYYLTSEITSITQYISKRVRPFYYNTSYTPEERYNMQSKEVPEGKSSFISGHASGTFAAAVFLSKTFTDIYGENTLSKIVWGVSLSAAVFTAYSRVEDGENFPSDVVIGAIIGSSIGYFIPVLHKNKTEKLSFRIFQNSVSFTYRF